MIPRYQRLLFWCLAISILAMSTFLIHGCRQTQKRFAALNDTAPIEAPSTTTPEEIALYTANDSGASISITDETVPLPAQPTLRARAVLDRLFTFYASPESTHPLPTAHAIDDVFLLNLPLTTPATPVIAPAEDSNESLGDTHPTDTLAVINLRKDFCDQHPSGIVTEDLTIRSIVGTIHGALPRVTEIRFLVDGQPRETLAGHADLTRIYPAEDTAMKPAQPQENQ